MTATLAALIAALLAGQTAPADPACPQGVSATALPAEMKGWSAMQGVRAGRGLASPATLAIGRSARAALVPAAAVKFPVAPEKPAEAGSSAGLFAFDVAAAGTYRVALGAAAWIDVVQGNRALESAAHGHGPDCSGVRKQVDFKLTPGRYLLQLSGAKTATVAVMVAKVG
jgi:hypothetical protein